MLLTPVGFGALFLAVTLVTARAPHLLTGPTERAIRQYARLYFEGLDNTSASVLSLLVIQGPYLLSVFGALTGLRVGRKFTRQEIESGRIELLIASPYAPEEVFRGLIASSAIITLIQLFALAVVGLGGAIVLLLSLGVSFNSQVSELVYASFLTPIPAALWAVVVTVVVTLFSGESRIVNNLENVTNIVGIAPAFGTLLVLSFAPGVDILWVTFVTLGVSLAGTIIGSWTVDRWFTVDRALSN
ncbi:hypothetical protein [Halorussus halobius]|uniref:hypothetical protein n=1 Tax=Halorussus halobius TaxID=1710537 RepID=UPI001091D562|nr:hypothetical protein [Halorussus halobius]